MVAKKELSEDEMARAITRGILGAIWKPLKYILIGVFVFYLIVSILALF